MCVWGGGRWVAALKVICRKRRPRPPLTIHPPSLPPSDSGPSSHMGPKIRAPTPSLAYGLSCSLWIKRTDVRMGTDLSQQAKLSTYFPRAPLPISKWHLATLKLAPPLSKMGPHNTVRTSWGSVTFLAPCPMPAALWAAI